jgi:hypothetical protein
MKVKTNVRAGKQNRGGDTTGGDTSGHGTDNPIGSEDPVVPPISRCVGI